jgi:hypothetical protein
VLEYLWHRRKKSIHPRAQITVLYDAFGQASAMQKDWGYVALVEYGGKRILFDTGTTPTFSHRTPKRKTSTSRSWISSLCPTGTAITWVDWPTF